MTSMAAVSVIAAALRRSRGPALGLAMVVAACGVHDGLIGVQDEADRAPSGSGSMQAGGAAEMAARGGRDAGGDPSPQGATTASGATAGVSSDGNNGRIGAVVGALDGRLALFPCASDGVSNDDCDALGYVVDGVVHGCSEGKSEMVLDHRISGAPGTRFVLTLHFYGIVEPKNYGTSATREAAPGPPDRNGGEPPPWASAPPGKGEAPSSSNSYELRVHDAAGLETARFYLNASPNEGHWTLVLDYEKSVEVEAGGFVRLRSYDNNCRLMKNCGGTGVPPCAAKARTVDVSAAEPSPPTGAFPIGLNQPGINLSASDAGQWLLVDVTAVTEL